MAVKLVVVEDGGLEEGDQEVGAAAVGHDAGGDASGRLRVAEVVVEQAGIRVGPDAAPAGATAGGHLPSVRIGAGRHGQHVDDQPLGSVPGVGQVGVHLGGRAVNGYGLGPRGPGRAARRTPARAGLVGNRSAARAAPCAAGAPAHDRGSLPAAGG